MQTTERMTTYFVNSEEQKTEEHKLKVRTVLEEAGFRQAENYDLTRDEGHHTYSNYDEEIPIHQSERFTATYKGPTPVS
jgi:phenylalanyl-tRNA synthetase beta subunit